MSSSESEKDTIQNGDMFRNKKAEAIKKKPEKAKKNFKGGFQNSKGRFQKVSKRLDRRGNYSANRNSRIKALSVGCSPR